MALSVKIAKAIMSISDEDLYSAPDIAKAYLKDQIIERKVYTKLKNGIYQAGQRNGLTMNPANPMLDQNGNILRTPTGRAILAEGERFAVWQGKQWKALVDYDPFQEEESPSKKAKDPIWQRIRRKRWAMPRKFAAISCGLFIFLGVVGFTFYDYRMMDIFHRYGVKKALNFMVSSPSESLDMYVDAAYLHFMDGNYDEAEAILHNVMGDRAVTERVLARVHSMKMTISIEKEDHELTRFHYKKAKAFYGSIGRYDGLAYINLELARHLRRASKTEEALQLVTEAEGLVGLTVHVQKQYLKIYYQMGQYEVSLKYAEMILESNNNTELADAMIHIAHCQIILGRLDDAFHSVCEADALIESIGGNDILRFYNHVQRVYLSRCFGKDAASLRQQILEWAGKNGGYLHIRQLEDLDELPCPSL